MVTCLVSLLMEAFITVVFELFNAWLSLKPVMLPLCYLFTVLINIFWIIRLKVKNFIVLPMVILSLVNITLVTTCFQIHLFLSADELYPETDALCRYFKWIQTSCAMMASALFVYVTMVFRHPQAFLCEIKRSILWIFGLIPILMLPQVRFKCFNFYYYGLKRLLSQL